MPRSIDANTATMLSRIVTQTTTERVTGGPPTSPPRCSESPPVRLQQPDRQSVGPCRRPASSRSARAPSWSAMVPGARPLTLQHGDHRLAVRVRHHPLKRLGEARRCRVGGQDSDGHPVSRAPMRSRHPAVRVPKCSPQVDGSVEGQQLRVSHSAGQTKRATPTSRPLSCGHTQQPTAQWDEV